MSRIARKPLRIPANVTVSEANGVFHIKGPKGEFYQKIHDAVKISISNGEITATMIPGKDEFKSQLGTACVLLDNCFKGVTVGFERKLLLVGVGYRAKVQGNNLELTLGYSHPVVYPIPVGIQIEAPSNTEILLRGISKELVGQTAAEIRSKRLPEPYKGKGVRYADETIVLKETKKKK